MARSWYAIPLSICEDTNCALASLFLFSLSCSISIEFKFVGSCLTPSKELESVLCGFLSMLVISHLLALAVQKSVRLPLAREIPVNTEFVRSSPTHDLRYVPL